MVRAFAFPMALRILCRSAQVVFRVTLMYLARTISEMPSLFVAAKYRARNHLTSDNFVFAKIVPAVAEACGIQGTGIAGACDHLQQYNGQIRNWGT